MTPFDDCVYLLINVVLSTPVCAFMLYSSSPSLSPMSAYVHISPSTSDSSISSTTSSSASSSDSSSSSSRLVLSQYLRATLIDTHEFGCGVNIRLDQLIGVGVDGVILFIESYSDDAASRIASEYTLPSGGLRTLSPRSEFIIPGFIDGHCHAPQFQFTGAGTDRDLMVWLQTYTFPAEMRMKDASYARRVYKRLVRASLSAGTTSVFYYGTIHLDATKALVDECYSAGQRAFVGKVAMDQHSPIDYVESTADSLADTEAFIQYVLALDPTGNLVKPVVTPRFIPTCSIELMNGLGALAKKYDCWIQSHASESGDQVAFVQSLLPNLGAPASTNDDAASSVDDGLVNGRCTGIFESVGLLSSQTMMAHGTFLTSAEWRVFRARGVSIAHCPLSNSFCSDKYLKVKPLVRCGNKVALGSDIAGGYQLSILANVRQAVITSKFHTADIDRHTHDKVHVTNADARPISAAFVAAQIAAKAASDNTANDSTLSYTDAFWLATTGGAEAINMSHKLGRFEVGFIFDAQHIDVQPNGNKNNVSSSSSSSSSAVDDDDDDDNSSSSSRTIHLFPSDTIADVFQKFINLGDDRHVAEVYVNGRQVKSRK